MCICSGALPPHTKPNPSESEHPRHGRSPFEILKNSAPLGPSFPVESERSAIG